MHADTDSGTTPAPGAGAGATAPVHVVAAPPRAAHAGTAEAHANSTTGQPLVSMLLIAYNQCDTVAEAIAGALAQTYRPLEIIISDDASSDATWAAMQTAVAGYAGPHTVRLNRNPHNLGIGAHLSHLAQMATGELLFVAAGDDVSLPQRCERVVQAWLAGGRRADLVAAALVDVDAQGHEHGVIRPSNLATYRDAADWLARPPHVVGAGQAWTRRLLQHYGPLPGGVVAEDLIMVLRAVMHGGAITLDEPLVRYRRGGVSRRRRALHAHEVVERLLKNNRHALVELPQLLADAALAGQLATVAPSLNARLAREQHIERLFAAPTTAEKLRQFRRDTTVPLSLRLRLLVYAAWPGLLAPLFWLKRRLAARRA